MMEFIINTKNKTITLLEGQSFTLDEISKALHNMFGEKANEYKLRTKDKEITLTPSQPYIQPYTQPYIPQYPEPYKIWYNGDTCNDVNTSTYPRFVSNTEKN